MSNEEAIDEIHYSRFKHGCVSSTQFFAKKMGKLLDKQMVIDNDTVFTSSAYLTVPNAASSLLELILVNDSNQVSSTKLTRNEVFDYDYACLEQSEREQSMRGISLDFDVQDVKNKKVIVIDDAYVTGAHEQIITQHLGKLPVSLSFYYLLDLSDHTSPTVENQVNSCAIHYLEDLLPLMNDPAYRINSRTLKFILSKSLKDFISFLNCVPSNIYLEIYVKAVSEGYLKNRIFSQKVAYIHQMVTRTEATV